MLDLIRSTKTIQNSLCIFIGVFIFQISSAHASTLIKTCITDTSADGVPTEIMIFNADAGNQALMKVKGGDILRGSVGVGDPVTVRSLAVIENDFYIDDLPDFESKVVLSRPESDLHRAFVHESALSQETKEKIIEATRLRRYDLTDYWSVGLPMVDAKQEAIVSVLGDEDVEIASFYISDTQIAECIK